MSGSSTDMTRSEVLARARSAIGRPTIYRIGKGGFLPEATHPANSHAEADCSGFCAWALGISRHLEGPWYGDHGSEWFETTAIATDAQGPQKRVERIEWANAVPSDLLVYGDHDGHQGHVGLVSLADPSGPIKAIHCSNGNFKNHGDAIQETGAALWIVRGVVARWRALVAS